MGILCHIMADCRGEKLLNPMRRMPPHLYRERLYFPYSRNMDSNRMLYGILSRHALQWYYSRSSLCHAHSVSQNFFWPISLHVNHLLRLIIESGTSTLYLCGHTTTPLQRLSSFVSKNYMCFEEIIFDDNIIGNNLFILYFGKS